MGSMTGVGFYLERRNNLKIETHNKKIDVVDEHLDELAILQRQDMKEFRGEMNQMEKRICDTFNQRLEEMQKSALMEVARAKELADQRINHLQENLGEVRKGIQNMERNYHRSDRYTRQSTQSKRNDAEDDLTQEQEDENNNGG